MWVPKDFLSEEEWRKFCERARKETLYWHSLLLFLAFTGCRVSEACKLKWDDINFDESIARIWKSKGGRSRWVPLNKEVKELLKEWRKSNESVYVWPSKRGSGHIVPSAVYKKVRKIGEELGLKIHPHTLRHTFATLLLNKGTQVHVVKELLGHSSLGVTGRYLHIASHQLKEAVEKLELE